MIKRSLGLISTLVMVMFLTGCFACLDTFKYWEGPEKGKISQTEVCISVDDSIPTVAVIKIKEVVMFDWDSNVITSEGQVIIDKVVKIMNENPDINLYLPGYASAEGSDTYNQGLSQRRVDAVKVGLMDQGISGDKITAEAKGETILFGDLLNLNRRVIVLSVE